MRTTIIALAVLVIGLTGVKSQADDYCFADPYWEWDLQDYPRWHYEGDNVWGQGDYIPGYLFYIQLELTLSDNSLVEPNVITMELLVAVDTGSGAEYYSIYFDIGPGETYIEEQVEIEFYSYYEDYQLREENTVPEDGGWIVIDEENTWVDRFIDNAVKPVSFGKVKSLLR